MQCLKNGGAMDKDAILFYRLKTKTFTLYAFGETDYESSFSSGSSNAYDSEVSFNLSMITLLAK